MTPLLTAEELVYAVADEMELTELEYRRSGKVAEYIAEEVVASIRIQLKRLNGRQVIVEDYKLPSTS
jgi:hypothetical protein